MKKRIINAVCRYTAFLIVLTLAFLSIPVTLSAEEEKTLFADMNLEQPFSALEDGDLTYTELQTRRIEDVELPETITFEEAQEKQL